MSKILVVDDSKFMRKKLYDIIEEGGHSVVGEAENGKDAFKKYKKLKPDVVIMDIMMPETNGIEGLKLIKEFDSKAKVIMCTTLSNKQLLIKAIKLGAPDYIIKPFKDIRVIDSINSVLSRK